MIEITWRIIPLDTPRIWKHCGRCGIRRGFVSTHQFRVNAQQKNLDVWLIWQCEKCGCVWNMDVFSRVKAGEIGSGLYQGLLENNIGLAYRYAYDADVLYKNNADVCYDDIRYTVEGPAVMPESLKASRSCSMFCPSIICTFGSTGCSWSKRVYPEPF